MDTKSKKMGNVKEKCLDHHQVVLKQLKNNYNNNYNGNKYRADYNF